MVILGVILKKGGYVVIPGTYLFHDYMVEDCLKIRNKA